MNKNSLLIRDIKKIIKNNIKELLRVSLIIGFLFYLFNIFFSLNINYKNINNIVTEKIGIYFYINDTQTTHDETYKRIINIKDELAKNGIKAVFSSKEDAYNFLENKIPEITKNFNKFGIDNPLPSTLYVMFHNKKEYNTMKDIIIKNKDLILNVKDIDKGATLQSQENRSLRILGILETIQNSIYFILILLSIIILSFTQHLLKTFFYDFHKELEVKKLLGATHRDANGGFILTLLFIITVGFIIGLALIIATYTLLNYDLTTLGINLTLYSIIPRLIGIYIIFSLIATGMGYARLNKLEKNI